MQDLHELPKLRDGLSYLYVDKAVIERTHKAIEVFKEESRTMVPASALGVLLLGPGTSITHAAVNTLAENGCAILWVGEDCTRFYAQGLGETRKAYRLLRQAALTSDPVQRQGVVLNMYRMRFADVLDPSLTLPQIRGLEGVRVRKAYADASRRYGVAWHGRNYDRHQWNNSDPVNRALSAANALLNGLCHTAIVSGGYSPALGFVHTGKQLSFVYDIADLYKVEITIPTAFATVAESRSEVEKRVRVACRERFREVKLLERILPDIDRLLDIQDEPEDAENEDDLTDVDADPGRPTRLWSALWKEED